MLLHVLERVLSRLIFLDWRQELLADKLGEVLVADQLTEVLLNLLSERFRHFLFGD